jgi:LPXTG-site transpeptidase (sortase) family protein
MTYARDGSVARRALGAAQWASILLGTLLSGFYALAVIAGEVGGRADLDAFAAGVAEPDRSLWSETRVREFTASQSVDAGPAVAVLRIPSLKLTVPVYPDESDLHLNRGAGLVAGSGSPDKGGNAAIAGHRDGYFRVLMKVQPGEIIEIQTRLSVHRYRITAIDIVDKHDNGLLTDTEDPTITLVTCYPFYFVGAAPQRFLVRGTYVWPAPSARS